MGIRGGSWSIGGFKLPEFGLTEAAGRLLGSQKTAQGGSDIFPNKPKAEINKPPPLKPPFKPPSKPPYVPPTGQPPPQGQGQQQSQDQGGQFNVPDVSNYVPSAEDEARRAGEERQRIETEKLRRFKEVFDPLQGDVQSYLTSRPDITGLFQKEMETQGIGSKQKLLGTLESEQTKLGQQLETLPGEDIARRKETGMLTASAERRVRAQEERPIREQLLKTSESRQAESVGLQRAFQLVDKMLSLYREQEQRGMEPLNQRVASAKDEFSVESEGFKGQIDSLAVQLTGFNKDREAKLKEYELSVDSGVELSLQQQREAADLKKQELGHLNAMEQIAARKKGQQGTDFDKTNEILQMEARIQEGATEADIVKEFVETGLLDISTAEKQLGKYNDILSANKAGKRED